MRGLLARLRRFFRGDAADQTAQPVDPAANMFNPLHARVGSGLRIDSPEYLGKEFSIRELLEYDFGRGDKVSCYVATSVDDGSAIRVRLQMDDGQMRSIACRLHDELDAEPGIEGAVADRGGIFVITRHDKNDEEERYTRINDLRVPREAKISKLSDANGDGEITPNEKESWSAKTWDYSRKTEVDGVTVREYLFVERTKLAAEPVPRFRIWRGLAVVPERISLE